MRNHWNSLLLAATLLSPSLALAHPFERGEGNAVHTTFDGRRQTHDSLEAALLRAMRHPREATPAHVAEFAAEMGMSGHQIEHVVSKFTFGALAHEAFLGSGRELAQAFEGHSVERALTERVGELERQLETANEAHGTTRGLKEALEEEIVRAIGGLQAAEHPLMKILRRLESARSARTTNPLGNGG
jgi:hypothetical protein